MLSSHPTTVRCDTEMVFITCSATPTTACSLVLACDYSPSSHHHYLIYVCVCVCLTNKKKILSVVKSSQIGKV